MTRYARRLQKIGSSVLISLPSEWVKHNSLKKGSTVVVEVNSNKSMSVLPSGDATEGIKEVTIPYPPALADSLVNPIYGAYLLGYDIIRIRGKSQILFDDAERIKRAMKKLVGLEIVDEDGFNISSQFLLDANTLDAEKILRRMNSIVAGMYRDTLQAIRQKEDSNAIRKVIVSRDDEVDRQYFLLVRLIRSAMMDQRLAAKLNLSNIDILDYRIAANLLESAGDYIVELADTVHDIFGIKFTNDLLEAGLMVENMQQRSVAAFVSKNRSESTIVARTYERFNELLDSIKRSATTGTKRPPHTIAILNSTYSLDRIARSWVDIADLVKPVYLTAPLENE